MTEARKDLRGHKGPPALRALRGRLVRMGLRVRRGPLDLLDLRGSPAPRGLKASAALKVPPVVPRDR
ncbi:hypothetical protein GCM10012319_42580 [Comamonas sp. KCTC 72670]|nr:hypothetical protein GCM10012319_42580 [Comamonas sp. KCTC 72670]